MKLAVLNLLCRERQVGTGRGPWGVTAAVGVGGVGKVIAAELYVVCGAVADEGGRVDYVRIRALLYTQDVGGKRKDRSCRHQLQDVEVKHLPVSTGSPSKIDGLVQERRNSIANAMELRLSYTKPPK